MGRRLRPFARAADGERAKVLRPLEHGQTGDGLSVPFFKGLNCFGHPPSVIASDFNRLVNPVGQVGTNGSVNTATG